MTGKRVHEIQVYSNCVVNMGFDYPTYGSVLDRQGVHTVHVGKVHTHTAADKLGFSEMILPGPDFAIPTSGNHGRRPVMRNPGTAKRAEQFGPREDAFNLDVRRMDAALDWLRKHATTLDRPWTLCINTVKPHFPHYATRELWDLYKGHEDLPDNGPDTDTGQHPYMTDLRDYFETEQFTEAQVRGQRRGYYGCVTFIDRQLGRILDTLEDLGILDETDVMYTTDHGEMLGEFGMWWKCNLLEDAARVPLIAAGPSYRAGVRIETPVDLRDVQASIFRSSGAARPAAWGGKPRQDIPVDDPERVVFSEYHAHGTRSGAYMIRKGDWKLISYMAAPHQLFNLADDPRELTNRYETEPAKAAELEADLRTICNPEAENEKAHTFEKRQFETMAAARGNGRGEE